MVSRFLHGLRRDTCLETELGARIRQLSRVVEVLAGFLEVGLDHVDVGVVVLVIDAWVPDDTEAELVETSGDLATFFVPSITVGAIEEDLHVDNGRLLEVELGDRLSDALAALSFWGRLRGLFLLLDDLH